MAPSIIKKLITLDLNKDVLLPASRSVGSLHRVEAAVCTVSIPDKQGAGSRYIDNVHHLFGDLHTVSVPDDLGNWTSSDGDL